MSTQTRHAQLINFVLEKSADESVSKRVTLYRALADIIGSSSETQELHRMASALEVLEKESRQFSFGFNQKIFQA